MNLYQLHNKPENLYGHDIAQYKVPFMAYELAKKNPRLRAKLEPVIMKDAWWEFRYAKYVIHGRWPEAEPVIMKDVVLAYYYAQYIIHGRWPEAEPVIMKDAYWWGEYKNKFEL